MPAALAWIAAYSVLGSLLSGFVFLVLLQVSLPETDAAAGTPLLDFVRDPFVLVVWRVGVALSAAFVFVVALPALRGRRITATFWRVLAITLLVVALSTPLAGPLACPLGVVTACAALIACRAVPSLATNPAYE